MSKLFEALKVAVANLAAPAEVQVTYLDALFGLPAAEYGNDELALELDDVFSAAAAMQAGGEISEGQIEAIRPLDEMLDRLSGAANADFWTRDALFHDPRWEEVRAKARVVLAML